MCGIAGLYKTGRYNLEDVREKTKLLTEPITHRGPDEKAFLIEPNIGLGMRRLSILDLTPGLYPFTTDDGNFSLIFNGEIYNFPELQKELIAEGMTFKSSCDGEVILKGFAKYGIEYIKRLRGMFALAIYSKVENALYLIRDRLGIKPIYYFNYADGLYFSSEIKSFIALKNIGINLSINESQIKKLLGFMYLPDNKNTIINDVHKVGPGCYLKVTKEKTEEIKYWSLDRTHVYEGTFDEALTDLENLLSETVEMHLLSDVPVGVMLSGGVDSSLITSLLVKKLGYEKINTFTAHFNHKFNESDLAQNLATELNTTHHDIFVDTSDVGTNIEKYISIFDSLDSLDAGIITSKIISDKIRETGVRVVLLGEGADELFGGYSWFGLSQSPYANLPWFMLYGAYYYATTRNISHDMFYYHKQLRLNFGDIPQDLDLFHKISNYELTHQLPNHLLLKVDKGTMAGSIEARVPYLDHKLVEFAYSLPANFKLKDGANSVGTVKVHEKYILRKLAEKYLNAEISSRKKKGFFFPMGDMLDKNMPKVRDYLSGNSFVSKFCSQSFINSLFTKTGFALIDMQREYFLWRLFILEVWYKNNFGSTK